MEPYSTLKTAPQLPTQFKRALEDYLGRQLSDDEHVVISVFTPPTDAQRAQAMANIIEARQMKKISVAPGGLTEEEEIALVDEAIAHVRREKAHACGS